MFAWPRVGVLDGRGMKASRGTLVYSRDASLIVIHYSCHVQIFPKEHQ